MIKLSIFLFNKDSKGTHILYLSRSKDTPLKNTLIKVEVLT